VLSGDERFSPSAIKDKLDSNKYVKFVLKENPLSKILDGVLNKPEGDEPLTFNKVLENITWVSIGVLVFWEIYINSPFFERLAPLAPVVFDENH
tara:strand:- start:132 stop:413 length:282 start_codon:yes stop_codon:yes gene_type:complete